MASVKALAFLAVILVLAAGAERRRPSMTACALTLKKHVDAIADAGIRWLRSMSLPFPLSLTKNNGGQTAVHVLSQDALIEQRLGEVNILENVTKFETLRQHSMNAY